MTIYPHASNIISHPLIYKSDGDININANTYNTLDGYNTIINDMLHKCNDVKLNNYNCLYVTSEKYNKDVISTQHDDIKSLVTSLSTISGYINSDGTFDNDKQTVYEIVFINDYICDIKYKDTTTTTTTTTTSTILSDVLYFKTPTTIRFGKNGHTYNNINTNWFENIFTTIPVANISLENTTCLYQNTSGGVLQTNQHANNNIISIQYNDDIENNGLQCNILTFKNQKTYSNYNSNGNYWNTSNFKSLENIQTGTWQEGGNQNITTVNEYFESEIYIQPGNNTFVTPNNLYPYEFININDTSFVKCGAHGGTTPALSDRIYTKRYNNIGDSTISICTWLSSCSGGDIWLDRYYNPILANTTVLNASSNVDKQLWEVYSDIDNLKYYGFFDKPSNLTITPNTEYTYYRLTKNDISDYILNQLHATYINNIKFNNKHNITQFSTNSHVFKNDFFGIISPIVNHNRFAISFDVDIYDWQQCEIYDLISSYSNDCGIRLYKNNVLTPILYTFTTSSVSIFNTKFEKIDEFTTDDEIKDVIKIGNFSYFAILHETSMSIYTLAGGIIKTFKYSKTNCINSNSKYIFVCYEESNKHCIDKIDKITFNKIKFHELSDIAFTPTFYYQSDDNVEYCSDTKIIQSAYVPGYGLFYIPDDDSWNSDVSYDYNILNNINKFLLLNTSTTRLNILNNGDTLFISSRKNEVIDSTTKIAYSYDALTMDDFCIFNNTIYLISTKSNTLYISDVERTNITQISLPIHTSGENINAYVYSTNEIKNNKYINQVFIILQGTSTTLEVYELKDNAFTLITKINNYLNYNFKHITGVQNLPTFTNQFTFEVVFKSNGIPNNLYSCVLDNILPGKHTILINISPIDGICDLYIDSDKYASLLEGNSNNTLTFSNNLLQDHILLGNSILSHGYNLASYIKNNDYLLNDIAISNIKLYNSPLNELDIYVNDSDEPFNERDIYINNLDGAEFADIVLTLPCGQKHEISQITKLFKHTVPGYKSTNFDIVVKNLNISEKNQKILTTAIKQYISNSLPVTVNLNEIQYKNY